MEILELQIGYWHAKATIKDMTSSFQLSVKRWCPVVDFPPFPSSL